MKDKSKIIIVLGSKSDLAVLEEGFKLLEKYNIPYRLEIISAHRNPDKLRTFCKKIERESVGVVIACAGLSAALPGFIASYVKVPVIGVPLDGGPLKGIESLLSIVEVPEGIGLVSTGIGKKGFFNAIIFALKILSLKSRDYKDKFSLMEKQFRK